MHPLRLIQTALTILPAFVVAPTAAEAQLLADQRSEPGTSSQQQSRSATAEPYKIVPVTPVQPLQDSDFEAFRKQMADIAARRDRTGLARMTVARNFFWDAENRDKADKRKPPVETLARILDLNAQDGTGWDILATYAADATAGPHPDRPNTVCAPGEPEFNQDEALALARATRTEESDWGVPLNDGTEVLASAQAGAAVIERLGLHFVRVLLEESDLDDNDDFLRVVTPSGKTGFIAVDALAPLGNDRLCYVKEAGSWKIAGFVGNGD